MYLHNQIFSSSTGTADSTDHIERRQARIEEKKVFLFLFCLGFSPIKLERHYEKYLSIRTIASSHAVCVEDSKLRNRVEVKKDHNNQKCQLPFKIDIPIR